MKAENIQYDSVFKSFGVNVVSNDTASFIREQNLNLPTGKIYDVIPQEGFQEDVLTQSADILIIGGRRGGGKTFSMLMSPLRNIKYKNFLCLGFRKEEADISRGIWSASKPLYSELAEPRETDFTWKFPSGANIKFEHLQNEGEIDRRFRGVEVPFMFIDELPQISFKAFFTLLGSNRNSFGIRNQFIGSCNPVDSDHWLYHFLWYYMDSETGGVKNSGKVIYFFKYGESIREIFWGLTKEEVYQKAKEYIDNLWDKRNEASGLNKYNLINSLCFIEGEYSQNKIFIKRDPSYLGNLAQQGTIQSIKDLKGLWGGSKTSNAEISAEEFDKIFETPEQRTGVMYAVADVALTRDSFTIGAFDGNHLIDVESWVGLGSITAVAKVQYFLSKHGISFEHFAFDSDGIGNYLKEPFRCGRGGAVAFNNNASSSDSRIWYNMKSECAEKFILAVKEGKLSIDREVQEKIMPDGKTFKEHLREQRKVLVRKSNSSDKYQLISKPEMKMLLGGKRSPDELDMMFMQQIFNVNKVSEGEYSGLGFLKFM